MKMLEKEVADLKNDFFLVAKNKNCDFVQISALIEISFSCSAAKKSIASWHGPHNLFIQALLQWKFFFLFPLQRIESHFVLLSSSTSLFVFLTL